MNVIHTIIAGCAAFTLGAPAPLLAAPPAPAPTMKTHVPSRLLTTAELGLSPRAAAAVDALAAMKRVESSHVGYAGSPSPVYAAFEAVVAAATPRELASLVRHVAPNVRAYVAQRQIRGDAPLSADDATLVTLATDPAVIETMDGCRGGTDTVGGLITNELRYNAKDKARAKAILERIPPTPTP